MKIIRYSVLLLTLGSITITQTGCFGTFALTRKAYNWHDGVSNNKFVKSLLLWIPMAIVYSITGMLDIVIFNLIEFWSGSNPLSMNEGDHEEQLVTFKGDRFRIEATKDTFTTTQLSGEKAGEVRILKFDHATRTWNYTDSKVCGQPVMTFLDDEANAVRVYTENGAKDLSATDLANTETLRSKLMTCGNEGLACAN